MTGELEELLHEGIDRLTAEARVPAGMVQRARRRHRQRQITIRASAVAGTALVVAVATIVATSAADRGTRPGQPGAPIQTLAYVTSRTQQALAGQRGAIEEIQVSARRATFGLTVLNMAQSPEGAGSAVVPGVLATVTAPRMVTWTYRGRFLSEGISATGGLVFHSTINEVRNGAGRQVTQVFGAAYPASTRWQTVLHGQPGPALRLTCQTALNLVAPHGSDWRAVLTKALSCGLYRLGGRQEVDGIMAIKLTLKPQRGIPIGETIWVNPATYLPVRLSATWLQAHGSRSTITYEYRWLPPTQGNLAAWHAALRRATIPPGFRTLPANYLPLPGANHPRR
jgi:hypothetical protein